MYNQRTLKSEITITGCLSIDNRTYLGATVDADLIYMMSGGARWLDKISGTITAPQILPDDLLHSSTYDDPYNFTIKHEDVRATFFDAFLGVESVEYTLSKDAYERETAADFIAKDVEIERLNP